MNKEKYKRQYEYYSKHKKEIYEKHKLKMQNDEEYRNKRKQMYRNWYEKYKNKNKQLEQDLYIALNKIDKAIDFIKEYGRDKQLEEEYLMNAYNLAMYNITLLEILEGEE